MAGLAFILLTLTHNVRRFGGCERMVYLAGQHVGGVSEAKITACQDDLETVAGVRSMATSSVCDRGPSPLPECTLSRIVCGLLRCLMRSEH